MLKLPSLRGMAQDLAEAADGLLRRGRKSVDTLADTLGEQAQVLRLAAKVRQLNRERAELLKEIGRKVYTLHTLSKVTNNDVLADCLKVDDIGARIAALRRQIDDLRAGPEAHVTVEIEDDSPLSEELSDTAGQEPVTEPETAAVAQDAHVVQVLEVTPQEEAPLDPTPDSPPASALEAPAEPTPFAPDTPAKAE